MAEVARVGRVVIYVSPDGVHNWTLLKPEDAPAWLQNPGTLGNMLKGYLGHRIAEGVKPGSPEDNDLYYAAVTIDGSEVDPAALDRAPVEPDPIHIPTLKYITPDDGNLPREMRVPLPTGDFEHVEVGLDHELQRHGMTRYQMLGDGGNGVPPHPALEVVRDGPSPVPKEAAE